MDNFSEETMLKPLDAFISNGESIYTAPLSHSSILLRLVAFQLVVHSITMWVKFRNLRALYGPPLDWSKLSKFVGRSVKLGLSEEELDKTVAYNKDRIQFGLIANAISLVIDLVVTLYYLEPWLWAWTSHFLPYSECVVSIGFICVGTFVEQLIQIPLELYNDFVIEERHGMNRKTLKVFFMDVIKGYFLACILLSAVLPVVIFICRSLKTDLWLPLTAFAVVVIFVLNALSTWLLKLFYTFEPLKAGLLRDSIVTAATTVGYLEEDTKEGVFVIDGSKRSNHSNAFMYGMFRRWRRIVLFDTLLNQENALKEDEITGIVAHELGHWKLSHVWISYAQKIGILGLHLCVFSHILHNETMFQNFGWQQAVGFAVPGILIAKRLLGPAEEVIGIVENLISRAAERAADKFGVQCGYGKDLAIALAKLNKENLGHPNPDRLYSWMNLSHPTVYERISYISDLPQSSKKIGVPERPTRKGSAASSEKSGGSLKGRKKEE